MNDLLETYPTATAVKTTVTERLITFEEYLDAEEQGEERHEFHNGKLITKEGGTDIHAELGANTLTAINNALFIKGNETIHVYSPDIKVQIVAKNKAVYPDGTVVDGEPIYYLGNRRVIVNPILMIEVLPDSSEKYDSSVKFDNYRTLDSFREYVLVAQDVPRVEVFFLQNPTEDLWKITIYEGLDKEVELHSIGCKLKMKQIYHRVFKPEVAKEEK